MPENTSNPTPEQIAAALRCCSGSNRELLCIDCAFLDGIYCLENDGFDMAADLILAQAARIRELEANLAAAEEKAGKAEADANYAKDRLAQAIGEANQAKAELKAYVEAEQWHDLIKNPDDLPEEAKPEHADENLPCTDKGEI